MKGTYLRMRIESMTQGHSIRAADIVASIQKEILNNPSAQGCRLPPIRVLAHQLGLSKNTVHAAYEELISRDLVISKKRQGFFVQTPDPYPPPKRSFQAGQASFRQLFPPLPYFESEDLIHLGNVFVDPQLLPTQQLTECCHSVLNQPGLFNRYDTQGYPTLRQKIAQQLRQRGIPAHEDHIVVTSGSPQSLGIVCLALQNRHIALETPIYPVRKRFLELNSYQVTGLPIDPFCGIDLDLWENAIATEKPNLLYLVSSYHQLTGYSYTTQEMERILELSQKYNFGILEDDWGSDLLSFSEYRAPLRTLGGENVIYMNSFTKKLLPSFRIGYLLGNEENIEVLKAAKHALSLGNSSLIETVLFEFLDRGYYESHLKQLHLNLDKRYQNCLMQLRKRMPKEVKWTTPGGGTTLWLEIPKEIQLSQLKNNLLERQVKIADPIEKSVGSSSLHGFLLGYAYLPEEKLNQALRILGEEINKFLKGSANK